MSTDWRIAAAAPLAAALPAAYPGGPSFKAGSRFLLSCSGAAGPLGVVSFVAPSPVALAMNIAYSAAQQAEALKRSFKYMEAPSPTGPVRHITSTTELFDYIERSMVAVFFSYQAIEAFCNEEILRISPAVIEVKGKKGKDLLEIREAERRLLTSEKLGNVLPKILNVSTIKGMVLWETFLELEYVRGEVVHLKNQTVQNIHSSKDAEQTLLTLLAKDACSWPRATLQILEHFVRDPIPDWYEQLKNRVI